MRSVSTFNAIDILLFQVADIPVFALMHAFAQVTSA